jgi:hypothetical protein
LYLTRPKNCLFSENETFEEKFSDLVSEEFIYSPIGINYNTNHSVKFEFTKFYDGNWINETIAEESILTCRYLKKLYI